MPFLCCLVRNNCVQNSVLEYEIMDTSSIVSVLWMIFGVVWLIAWLRTKRTQERAPLSSRLLYAVPVMLGSYLLFSKSVTFGWPRVRLYPGNPVIDAIAVFLTALGIGFAIWARFYLGTNWSSAVSVKVGHELIRTGPYTWVRHPIYSGLLLALMGTALQQDRVIALIAVALFWLGFWIKSRMEEEFMRKTFGQEYEEYSRSTGALIPKARR
jgi:protein-S-isoprenylcysteine O-methyltransferase Ste14